MSGFTKLFSSLVTSTIWREDDKTRVVWVTMLALADQFGFVAASLPGLAAMANVSIEECEAALVKLRDPDKYSRTRDNEGRRVEELEGGWRLLNYAKYRQLGRSMDRAEYMRVKQQESRDRKRQHPSIVSTRQPLSTNVNPSQPISEAEAEAEAERTPDSSEPGRPARELEICRFQVVGNGAEWWPLRASKHAEFVAAFPGVDVPAQYPKIALWLAANPTKRKTARGMARFLFGWLERQQNQSRNGGPPIANGAHPGEPPWKAAERLARQQRALAIAEAEQKAREVDAALARKRAAQ